MGRGAVWACRGALGMRAQGGCASGDRRSLARRRTALDIMILCVVLFFFLWGAGCRGTVYLGLQRWIAAMKTGLGREAPSRLRTIMACKGFAGCLIGPVLAAGIVARGAGATGPPRLAEEAGALRHRPQAAVLVARIGEAMTQVRKGGGSKLASQASSHGSLGHWMNDRRVGCPTTGPSKNADRSKVASRQLALSGGRAAEPGAPNDRTSL